MVKRLAVIFIIFLAIELWGIIEMVQRIGGITTFGLLLLTGILGGWFARAEGSKIWADARRQLQSGQMPGFALLDGLCVLAGGLLLLLPGFLSDIVGITLLLPFTRPIYRLFMYRWLEKKVRSGSISIRRGPF
ncbi:FxsA family protein [Cohnella faecalis]|uniref:FxsA family protein n=1 Tax=Cohnella faecalis TaxID=2315694 RepID=A0A398CKJ3_9BACL|nr:FxsA family protein [Cohnella faecalis]RIE02885.1 FxsA family protein [Cohnella faecalis]